MLDGDARETGGRPVVVEGDEVWVVVWGEDVEGETPGLVGCVLFRNEGKATGIEEVVEVAAESDEVGYVFGGLRF